MRIAKSTIPLTIPLVNFQHLCGVSAAKRKQYILLYRSPQELKSYDTSNLNLITQKLRQKGDFLECLSFRLQWRESQNEQERK